MIHNFKNYLKLGILLFGISFVLINCQKETDFEEENTNQSLITFEKIVFKEFKSKNESNYFLLDQSISKLNNSNANRTPNETNTYSIDSTNIVSINHISGYTSYTFSVISNTEPNLIQNIFISNAPNGSTSIYLLEYETNIPISDISDSTIGEHIIQKNIYNLENPTINYANRVEVSGSCVEVIISTENYCEDSDGNTIEDNGQLGNGCVQNWTTQEVTTIIIDAGCLSGGGSGGNTTTTNGTDGTDGTNGTNNTSGGGGNGSTSTSGNTNNNDNDSSCQENNTVDAFDDGSGNCVDGITTPLVPKISIEDEIDCETLKQDLLTLINNPTINSHINGLKDGIFSDTANNYKEDGVRFAITGINQYTPRYPNDRLNNSLDYQPDYQDNEIVSIHIHQQKYWDIEISPNPFFNAPVPSDEDIIELLKNVAYINTTNPNLASEVTQIVMTEAGVFAMVIDIQSALNILTSLEDEDTLKDFKERFKRKVLKKWNKINQNAGEVCNSNCLQDTAGKFKKFVENNKIAGSKLKAKVLQAVIDENDQITDWICN